MRLHEIVETTGRCDWPPDPVFHGVSSDEAARSIMRHGLDPNRGKSRFRGKLKPLAGKSYLSANLFHVIENYAFPEGDDNRYGYVLVFARQQVGNAAPDEDAVWTFMKQTVSNHARDAKIDLAVRDGLDPRVAVLAAKIADMATQAERAAMYSGTRAQQRVSPIVFGKRVLSALDADEAAIIMAHDWHNRIATDENLKPLSCWRFDRKDFPKLRPGCSNFTEIATCIG